MSHIVARKYSALGQRWTETGLKRKKTGLGGAESVYKDLPKLKKWAFREAEVSASLADKVRTVAARKSGWVSNEKERVRISLVNAEVGTHTASRPRGDFWY